MSPHRGFFTFNWQWHTEEQAKQTEWEPGLLQIVLLTTASYVRISSKLEED